MFAVDQIFVPKLYLYETFPSIRDIVILKQGSSYTKLNTLKKAMTLKHEKIDYIKKYLVPFFPSTNYLYTKALSIAI